MGVPRTGDQSPARPVRALALAAALEGATGPGRWHAEVAGVPVTSLGVPTDWSVQAHVGERLPDDDQLAELLRTLAGLGGPGFQVLVGHEHRHDRRWTRHGLREAYELPTFALSSAEAGRLEVTLPPGLGVHRARGREEFVACYGDWCGGRDLAAGLVSVEDLASPRREFWVAESDGVPVGTAIVHRGERSAHLSGIGILAPFRRRGYGTAVTALAAAKAAAGSDLEGHPVELVWMTASGDGAPLYERMGFVRVDVRVGFVPVGS